MKSLKKMFFATAILIGFATILPEVTHAQYVTRLAKDSVSTVTSTKYLTFTSTPDLVKGINLTATVPSGTISITAVIEQRIDTVGGSTEWVAVPAAIGVVGTVTASNSSSTVYQWSLTSQNANGYRIKITSNVAQKTYLYGSYIRRTTN